MEKTPQVQAPMPADIRQFIMQSLRVDFGCMEDEIDLIEHALNHQAPQDISNIIMSTSGPRALALLLHYLEQQFVKVFATIYWYALTSETPQDFYEGLCLMKKAPMFMKDIQAFRTRKEGK